jgi:hypothetical protein
MNLLLLSEDELDPDHDVNHTYSNPITAQAYKPHREPKQVSNIIQPPKVINDNTN